MAQWVIFKLALLFLFVTSCSGITITSSSQLTTLTFDYIIIGGGTAGLTLASRLSQNSTITVLVIEAGTSDVGVPNIQIPFMGTTLTPNTAIDWNYTTAQQIALLNRTLPYPRGRVLGGCSSVNYMFHQYGASGDWDRLANFTGDTGWQWSNMRQFVPRHEKLVAPADNHNTADQCVTASHGTAGTLPISLPGFNQSIDSRVFDTTLQLSTEFPYNEDMSGGDNSLLGIGFLQSSIGAGVRSSSATTYLQNATARPNLTLLLNTTAIAVVQTPGQPVNPPVRAFRLVNITQSLPDAAAPTGNTTVPLSSVTTVSAVREVIISAGAINTAKLLQLSGIGASRTLGSAGLRTILDLPAGQNLADHLVLTNVFSVTGNTTLDPLLRSTTQIQAAITSWQTTKQGMMANTLANNLGYFRLPANSTIFKNVSDPAAGTGAPHWEMIFSNFWFNPGVAQPATGNFMTIPTVLVSPVSRGTVKITNLNPFQPPVIDPQFLTSPFDVFTMRETILALQRFVAAPAWSDYIIGPFGSAFTAAMSETSDTGDTTLIDTYVQEQAVGLFHPTGTAAMQPVGGVLGVVQPNLTVRFTEGLRVVDASVFPFPFSTHPQGAVYLLAERAATIIIQSQT